MLFPAPFRECLVFGCFHETLKLCPGHCRCRDIEPAAEGDAADVVSLWKLKRGWRHEDEFQSQRPRSSPVAAAASGSLVEVSDQPGTRETT